MDDVLRFKHDPQSLLSDLPQRWAGESLRGVVVIAIDEQGRLIWDGAGYSAMELIWAMEKFKHEILFGGRNG